VIEEREFQTKIAQKATEGNTLVVLPTATGKTIIGALAASHFLYNYSDRKFLMMAPTKPLVRAELPRKSRKLLLSHIDQLPI